MKHAYWETFSWCFFSEYILDQYLTLHREKSVIIWVEEEHEIMSDKGFFKQVFEKEQVLQKITQFAEAFFQKLSEAANFVCSNKHSCWNIHWVCWVSVELKYAKQWLANPKKSLTSASRSLCHSQILNPRIYRFVLG